MKGMAFCDEMSLAILNTKPDVWPAEAIDPGKPLKSQTRRRIKNQPPDGWVNVCSESCPGYVLFADPADWKAGITQAAIPGHARFKVGEVFYVKEGLRRGGTGWALYSADNQWVNAIPADESSVLAASPRFVWRWKRDFLPSIFMPREAARTFGVIKAIRAERVAEASPADAYAEGLGTFVVSSPDVASEMLAKVWNHLHGPDAWERNEWVRVYEFARVSPETITED